MKRQATQKLLEWKESKSRKPLIVRGAMRTGKTWLMQDFGRNHFKSSAYINFDGNERMRHLFSSGFGVPELIEGLQTEAGQRITPNETLLIFDEVQEVPGALASLRLFCDEAPEYPILAGSSLLGAALRKGASLPIGKVDFLALYPMCFFEFLEATGQEGLVALLRGGDWEKIGASGQQFIDALKKYYYVGGMPEAVAAFAESGNLAKARKAQKQILKLYERLFSSRAPCGSASLFRKVWRSIPAKLKTRAKTDYDIALEWLADCGLLYKRKEKNQRVGNSIISDETDLFKAYMVDVGLLSAKFKVHAKTMQDGDRIFGDFYGALTEQYIFQELISNGITPAYNLSAESFSFNRSKVSLNKGSGEYPVVAHKDAISNIFVKPTLNDFNKVTWSEIFSVPLYAISADFMNFINE
jgi:predicted AAA+ superfamily ATPase